MGKDADEYWQRVYQDVVSGEMKITPMDRKRRGILELQRRFQRHEIRRNSEIQDSIATSPIIHMERRKRVVTDWQA